MPDDKQAPIGDNVELPAGASRTYAYRSDGGEYINLVELVADAADTIEARVYIDRGEGSRVDIPRTANDGEDNPENDRYSTKRIDVSTVVGETRYTLLQPLGKDDRIVFELTNTDGAAAQRVRFRAAAASTLRAAVGGDN